MKKIITVLFLATTSFCIKVELTNKTQYPVELYIQSSLPGCCYKKISEPCGTGNCMTAIAAGETKSFDTSKDIKDGKKSCKGACIQCITAKIPSKNIVISTSPEKSGTFSCKATINVALKQQGEGNNKDDYSFEYLQKGSN